MEAPQKKLPAVFYRTPSDKEPVRDRLKGLEPEDKKKIGTDIATVEYAWPIGKPLCGSLGDGLWEVRSNIGNGRISRVIFSILDGRMVLLHLFIKKTRKTPAKDRDLALKRKKDIER